jgi:hypothetical protein
MRKMVARCAEDASGRRLDADGARIYESAEQLNGIGVNPLPYDELQIGWRKDRELATRFVRIWIDKHVIVVESWTITTPALGKAALEGCGTHECFWREIDAVGLAQRSLPFRDKDRHPKSGS